MHNSIPITLLPNCQSHPIRKVADTVYLQLVGSIWCTRLAQLHGHTCSHQYIPCDSTADFTAQIQFHMS